MWQRRIAPPPDGVKLCLDEEGRLTICPRSIRGGDIDPAFLRAILLGRIGVLANKLIQVMPDYTYVFGDAWDPDTGWVNLLSRLQVGMLLDYTPFTDVGGLISPVGGIYQYLPPQIVVVDEADNPIPFWNDPPWLWIRLPEDAVGPTVKLYAVLDPLVYDPSLDRPENVFTAPSGWVDSFEEWSGWLTRGSGICRQVCDGARQGLCMLSKETYCDPNGCYKQLALSLDRSTTALMLEAWVYRPNAGSDCGFDQILVVNTAGNGYNAAVNMFTGELSIIRRSSWTGTKIATGSLSATRLDAWYLVRLALFPDGTIIAEVWSDELERLGRVEATDTTYNTFDAVAVLGGRPYRVDALRVRRLPWQEGVYQLQPAVTLTEKQVYVYPIELGETIQAFTATIDADELVAAEYSLDGGATWTQFTPETVVDIAQYQATSIALKFTVKGQIRAWAMLVKTLT